MIFSSKRKALLVNFLLSCLSRIFALDNGLALTPPMGWLSWERFGCQVDCTKFPDDCVSENLYLAQGKRLVQDGYREAGYEYVNIDDCWSELERQNGKIVEDRKRFPNGMKNLSSTLHSWGLKLGIYGDIGTKTCVGYPGFEGHFEQDAATLALDFEIDSVKVDACNANESNFNTSYPAFGNALNRTGRPILYSCSWPNDYYEKRHHWEKPDYLNHGIKQTCNTWRNYFDVFDSWDSISKIVDFWARSGPNDVMVRAGGHGGWNDPDMLVIGNPGLSISEQAAQFAFWAIFAAPLMISSDLRTIPDESRDILLNQEIIAVNQDPLGRQGWCADPEAPSNGRIWIRELQSTWNGTCGPGESDSWVVLFENRNTIFREIEMTFDPSKHLPSTWKGPSEHTFSVRDLMIHSDLGIFDQTYTTMVDESHVALIKIVLLNSSRAEGVSLE